MWLIVNLNQGLESWSATIENNILQQRKVIDSRSYKELREKVGQYGVYLPTTTDFLMDGWSAEKPLKNRVTGKNFKKKVVLDDYEDCLILKCYHSRICSINKLNETIVFPCFVEFTNSVSKAMRSFLHYAGWYEVENVSKEQLRKVILGQPIKRSDFKKMIEWHPK